MFPWMREHIAEVWHSRKGSARTAERQSLPVATVEASNSETAGKMLTPVTISPENFSVNVISLEGEVANITVKPDFTVERIKTTVLKQFYGQDTTKESSQFHLVHSSKFKQHPDNCTVTDEEISEHDDLMLVEIRTPPVKENLSDESMKGPTKEVILKATSGLPIRNPPRPVSSIDCPADFQNEIRKILITLAKASARILVYNPESPKFCNILKENLEARCKPNIDPNSVKTLMEIGYSRKKVLKALRLRKSNMTEALDWLIEHQDDSDNDDDDLNLLSSKKENDTDPDVAGPSSSGNVRKRSLKEVCDELFEDESQDVKKEENLITIVNLLLDSIRVYKKMDFKPNSRAVQSLLEMGFDEKSIISALKVTGNDQANACEWLLGERRPALQDLDEGLEPDSPIYKAIMNNPVIQLSLTVPKMLLVYLSMLETSASTNIWINDPEVSPVLSQIFKTYHAEKHAIQMNRFAAN